MYLEVYQVQYAKEFLVKYFEKVARKKERTIDDLIAGGIAGTAAVFGTQPLERIATQKAIKELAPNATRLQKLMHSWSGSAPRAVKGAMAAGITFGVHGLIKKHLQKNER